MRLLILLLLAPVIASAQSFSTTRPLRPTSITGGAELGVMDYRENSRNHVYADGATWSTGDFPVEFLGQGQLLTLSADEDTTGDTAQYTVDLDVHTRVWVWHPDGITTKPQWLLNDYLDCGYDAILPGGPASGYCRTMAPGTLSLGGNYPTGGSGSNPMYAVSLVPATRFLVPVSIPPPDDPGFVRMVNAAIAIEEGDPGPHFVGQIERHSSADGAATATVADSEIGSCDPMDYSMMNEPNMQTWEDGELGIGSNTAILLTVPADVSDDCDIVFIIESTSGVALDTSAFSETVTILDTDTPSTVAEYYVNGATGSDGNTGLTPAQAWKTPGRANSVAHPGGAGNVVIYVTGGPIRGTWAPQNSGLSSTQRILLQCMGASNIKWYGPTGGTMDYFFDVTGEDYVGIAQDPDDGCLLDLDGECSVSKNGGIPTGCHVLHIGRVEAGEGRIIEAKTTNTRGYWGVRYGITQSTARYDCYSVQWGRHGNIWAGAGFGGDYGDAWDMVDVQTNLQAFHRITGGSCD